MLEIVLHLDMVGKARGKQDTVNSMDTGTASPARYRMFIGGEWTEAASGATFESINPYTGRPWALIPRGGRDDVDRAVRAAQHAFTHGDWPKLTATQRGALLRKLADLIAPRARELAEIEVRDNGKLISEMSAQTQYMAQWYYYYGGLADKIETRHLISRERALLHGIEERLGGW